MSNLLTPMASRGVADPKTDKVIILSLAAKPRESAESVFGQLATMLKHSEATMVALFIYGDVAGREMVTKIVRRYLGAIDWPVLWVEGRSCNGALVAGVQAFAVRETEVERLLVKGRVVGTSFSDGDAQHCIVAGIGPDDPQATCGAQTHSTFENLRSALGQGGFDFADIARTWFYNEKLLEWYDVFNQVRTGYYSERPFRSGAVPASTGVEGRNPLGAALAIAAWATKPLNSDATVSEVESPKQCTALRYGSTFSRAMEIRSAGSRRLFVSGTASIAPEGHSIWAGDVAKQIDTSMEVIEAMLESRGMRFTDVVRATAYFKYPLDAGAFVEWERRRQLSLHAIPIHCDICRDDLLFELELDAVVSA